MLSNGRTRSGRDVRWDALGRLVRRTHTGRSRTYSRRKTKGRKPRSSSQLRDNRATVVVAQERFRAVRSGRSYYLGGKSPSRSPYGFRLNGAAQESNLPSRGLHDLTGFEGLRELVAPLP